MWMQPFNVMDESEVRGFVEAIGALDLVTVGQDGFPLATRLPLVWRDDRLILHMAIANPHWRSIADGSPALGMVTGPEAYITPSWYAGKRDGGLVVPTWNYSAVQFRGRVTVHRDSQWLLDAVTVLSDEQESPRVEPWAVSDAPESFIAQQLKAIVGIEFVIEEISAKAKRSQNRSEEDRRTVIAGLREGGAREQAVAAEMESDLA